MLFDALVVPRGAEARAVERGWGTPAPPLVPVAAGRSAGTVALPPSAATVLVLGLCGALDPALRIGESVVYSHLAGSPPVALDPHLTAACAAALHCPAVAAVSAPAVVDSVAAKAALRAATGAAVVDMEAGALAAALHARGIRVAMVRIVSDDAQGELPDLSGVYDAAGRFRGPVFAAAILRAPLRGGRFIAGALRALRVLRVTAGRLARA